MYEVSEILASLLYGVHLTEMVVSPAVMKSKRSQSWSESYDDFKVIEEKDPREREMERERILHHNNCK